MPIRRSRPISKRTSVSSGAAAERDSALSKNNPLNMLWLASILLCLPSPADGFHQSHRLSFATTAHKDSALRVSSIIDDLMDDSSAQNNEDRQQSLKTTSSALADTWRQLGQRHSTPREGLSRFHQSLLQKTHGRQRCVTGHYPIQLKIEESAARKWLGSSETQLLVNGTAVEESLASFDRFQWIDDAERFQLQNDCSMVSLELIGEIHLKKPGYVNILPTGGAGASAALRRQAGGWGFSNQVYRELEKRQQRQQQQQSSLFPAAARDRLWVTGFSLTGSQGFMHAVDVHTGELANVQERTSQELLWPNECTSVPSADVIGAAAADSSTSSSSSSSSTHTNTHTNTHTHNHNHISHMLKDALLVSDGFLVPGKNRGGLYIVEHPGHAELETTHCLTSRSSSDEAWFYHRSVWIDDGRRILTARARVPTTSAPQSQLVVLDAPQAFGYASDGVTPVNEDGTLFDPLDPRHLPWKEHVLTEGPDVMFTIADLDPNDDTIEVLASEFFDRKVSLHSIQLHHPNKAPEVVFSRVIDDNCGAAFGAVLADLDPRSTAAQDKPFRVIDSGSTVETLKKGDAFSHLLVTSHECSLSNENGNGGAAADDECQVDGGSLFAFQVPTTNWRTDPWHRTTVASGFAVRGQLGNMINPGAPGFCYTFWAHKDDASKGKRPLIAVAGDCSESAYLFRPSSSSRTESLSTSSTTPTVDPAAAYTLQCEIECGATVGSIGIGYDSFCHAPQEDGYAKLYVPCFEKDKVLVFSMGSGEDDAF